MPRPSLVLVVLVLALSAIAAAGVVAQENQAVATPVVGTTPGEPSHLAINESDVRRSNTTSLDLDVGSAISADSTSLQTSYLRLQFEAALENASTDEARTQVVTQFAERFGNRTATLEARDRANIEAYASGSITAEQYLRERARINSRADRLQQATSDITELVPRRLNPAFDGVDGRLEVIQGPISASAGEDAVGTGSDHTIYAEVSNSAYTLSSISGEEYTRETYLIGARYPERPDQFANGTGGLSGPQDRVLELYPSIGDDLGTIEGVFRSGEGVYRVSVSFSSGEKQVYLSGGTREVFREEHTRTLTSFDTSQSINRTDGDLRLTVNRTYETGPAEIALRDPATGIPVNGTVTIGQQEPRWVGDDGRLWIVEPRGDVQLNATVGATRISTSI